MKTRTLAATMFAATTLALLACNWFGKKPHQLSPRDITGKWIIDSVRKENELGDSVKPKGSWGVAFSDSLPVTIDFGNDSAYALYDKTGAELYNNKYYLDSPVQKLFVKQGASFSPLSVTRVSDSTIQAAFDDAPIWYYMKKQP